MLPAAAAGDPLQLSALAFDFHSGFGDWEVQHQLGSCSFAHGVSKGVRGLWLWSQCPFQTSALCDPGQVTALLCALVKIMAPENHNYNFSVNRTSVYLMGLLQRLKYGN